MKRFFIVPVLLAFVFFITGTSYKTHPPVPQQLAGAWQRTTNGQTELLLFADGYCSYTLYNKEEKQFQHTSGGPFSAAEGKLEVIYEFHSLEPGQVSKKTLLGYSLDNNMLTISRDGAQEKWQMLDNGQAPLTGKWQITKRMQDGRLQTIHQTGTRKTVKLLSGTRFQWIAIDAGVKGFYGTGGGTYTFKDGVYTEHIDFFSRDSSRVGAHLSFMGKLNSDGWHHSGKSSKGEDIYEVWSRSR